MTAPYCPRRLQLEIADELEIASFLDVEKLDNVWHKDEVIKCGTEEAEDFGKKMWNISGLNILTYNNSLPQQKLQQ